VEDLEWNLSPGFTAVTGETGSGKSIILGALKLLLGERAERTLIRAEAESCAVEGAFRLPDSAALDARLAELGIDPCADSELIVKRVFSHSGTNRQFINCCATTLAILKEVGDSLVDLHGPHEHQSLLSADNQLGLLDAFAGAGELRASYQTQFRALARLAAERENLSAGEAALEREVDLLKHQVNEIEAADFQPGEGETLLKRYTLAANGRRLAEVSSGILQRLAEADDAVLNRLGELRRFFRDLEKLDPASSELAAAEARAASELEGIAGRLREYGEQLDIDPAELARLEERVTLAETLKRKYGGSIEEVIAFGQNAATRLRRIESRGEELLRLEKEIEAARSRLLETGANLTRRREKAAPVLAADVAGQLRDLGFRKSGFDIAVSPLGKPSALGLESVEFLFTPNPGEPPMPLKAIASSGEISRVMLAVKSSLAKQDSVPLLVFDEIDANVGGEIARSVGEKMLSLGAAHQVLCITHLPQVAGMADAQFVVTKEFENNRTVSRLSAAEGEARVEELARMLGGRTDSALAHARTLLSSRPGPGEGAKKRLLKRGTGA